MIDDIKQAAEVVGITMLITNSSERIETQLNRITRHEDLPIMLISWDFVTTLAFRDDGLLDNPELTLTALLMTKAEDNTKERREYAAEEMGKLFETFIQRLHNVIVGYQTSIVTPSITGASYTRLPLYGSGKHSGILANWSMKVRLPEAVAEC
jgi:antitoxin component of RelBE/YafQ-DinJ toxin-antitoxin module